MSSNHLHMYLFPQGQMKMTFEGVMRSRAAFGENEHWRILNLIGPIANIITFFRVRNAEILALDVISVTFIITIRKPTSPIGVTIIPISFAWIHSNYSRSNWQISLPEMFHHSSLWSQYSSRLWQGQRRCTEVGESWGQRSGLWENKEKGQRENAVWVNDCQNSFL